jgi:membrane protease YdiL (CAAX protease family)
LTHVENHVTVASMGTGSGRERAGALHGALIGAAIVAFWLGWPSLGWPWYFVLPILAYAGLVMAVPRLRRTAPRLAVGRLGGLPLAFAIVLCIATAAVLIAFDAIVRPDTSELAARLPVAAFGHWLLAGVCFSIANAALEEFLFRGLLWGAITDEWNDSVALVATSILFGVLHLHGYPPGPVGAVLAGFYAIALGLLRRWTNGLGLAVACHVFADATIFGLLARSGAFEM